VDLSGALNVDEACGQDEQSRTSGGRERRPVLNGEIGVVLATAGINVAGDVAYAKIAVPEGRRAAAASANGVFEILAVNDCSWHGPSSGKGRF
jgi:hypothetical protein